MKLRRIDQTRTAVSIPQEYSRTSITSEHLVLGLNLQTCALNETREIFDFEALIAVSTLKFKTSRIL